MKEKLRDKAKLKEPVPPFDFYCKECPSITDILICADENDLEMYLSLDGNSIQVVVAPHAKVPPKWWLHGLKQNETKLRSLLRKPGVFKATLMTAIVSKEGGQKDE